MTFVPKGVLSTPDLLDHLWALAHEEKPALVWISPENAKQIAQTYNDIGDGREALLNLIADATEWDEQQDEGGLYYTLKFSTDHSGGALRALMQALGLKLQTPRIEIEGESYPGLETPADALERILAAPEKSA